MRRTARAICNERRTRLRAPYAAFSGGLIMMADESSVLGPMTGSPTDFLRTSYSPSQPALASEVSKNL